MQIRRLTSNGTNLVSVLKNKYEKYSILIINIENSITILTNLYYSVNLAENALIAYLQADTVTMNVEFTFKDSNKNILENGTGVLLLGKYENFGFKL